MAPFWGQPEGTGPLWRDPALQLAYVEWPHRARCALSHTKVATVASIQYGLTGPSCLGNRVSFVVLSSTIDVAAPEGHPPQRADK